MFGVKSCRLPSNTMQPEFECISWVKWQLFCTLTFKGFVPVLDDQRKIAFAWLRAIAHDFKLPFHKLIWVLRLEAGDARGRLHLHALIAGLPAERLDTYARFHIGSLWTKKSGGLHSDSRLQKGGFAQIFPYDANSDCASYILKPGRVEETAYELRKFGGCCDVMLSKSLVGFIDRGCLRNGKMKDANRTNDEAAQDGHRRAVTGAAITH